MPANNQEDLEYEELKNHYMNNIKNFHFQSEKPTKQIFNIGVPSNINNYQNANLNNNYNQNDFLDNSDNIFSQNNNNQNNNINSNFDPLINNPQLSGDIPYEEFNPNPNANYLNNLISNNINNNNEYVNFSNNFNPMEHNSSNLNANQFSLANGDYNINSNNMFNNNARNNNFNMDVNLKHLNSKNIGNPIAGKLDEKSKEKGK